MMDKDQMILVITILRLLGHKPRPEDVQLAHQKAQRDVEGYVLRNKPPEPLR